MKCCFFCWRLPSFLIDLPPVKPCFGTTVSAFFVFVPLDLPMFDPAQPYDARDARPTAVEWQPSSTQ